MILLRMVNDDVCKAVVDGFDADDEVCLDGSGSSVWDTDVSNMDRLLDVDVDEPESERVLVDEDRDGDEDEAEGVPEDDAEERCVVWSDRSDMLPSRFDDLLDDFEDMEGSDTLRTSRFF